MITLNKNSLKYKDSDGNMRDSGVLFASDGENDYATKEELDQLSEEIDNLKENGTGATEEQIQQIESNKNDIVALKEIEHNVEKKYTIDICNIKNPSQTIGGDTNNLCLIATRSIQEFDKMPDCTGYLYYEKSTKKLYYSSVTPDNPVYLCDWNTSLANGEDARLWMASITADGDIVFLKYKGRRNPIIYPHDNYNAPYVVDFGNELAPYGYLMASSIVQFEDGSFVFGDYASHSVEEETNLNPRNIWRVTKPYNDVSNWRVCHSFKHVYFTSYESDEPDNEIGHIHAISYDWYSGVTYCNTGDIDRHCRIWKSMDKGITWSAIDGAVGTNKNPNIYDDGQKWRMASFVFTKDYCYWGTDSFFKQHVLYKCSRNVDGEADFSTIEKVCSLEPNNSNVHTQATYGHILLRNPNGIVFLDRGEPRTDGLLDITFYSFDDEELYICGTLERATTDIGSNIYEASNRIGLPNQCGTYYQPQCLDYVLIGGVYIRPNNTALFDNSVDNYVGALKLKVNEIGITQVAHQKILEIAKQPVDTNGSVGDVITFNVQAKGDGLKYQWYTMPEDKKWYATNITGNTTDTLTVELNASRIKYLYKCIVTDKYGNSVESDVVKVVEIPSEPEPETLSIVKQPTSVNGNVGDTVTFSVEATGDGLSYQWCLNILEGGKETQNWYKSSFVGSNTDTMTVELTESRMSNKYKCIITDSRGNTLESDVVWVSKPLEITQQPVDTQGEIGDTVTFAVKATGFRLKFQWHTSTNNGVSWVATGITGSVTDTLIVELNSSRITYLYKCIVSDGAGNSIESDVVKVI